MQPVHIAVVGLGYWGPNLVRVLHELEDAEVVRICDRDPRALAALHRRYPSVPAARSFEEVIADEEVEAVAIATPVGTHFELALAALKAGKHVFVEKPLADSSERAEQLGAEATRASRVLMPGHTFLYSPPVTLVRELLLEEALGEIYFVSMSRVNLGIHQSDVSVAWDLGAHDFSILRYWFDDVPERVSALSRSCILPGVADIAFVNLQFGSGTLAHVEMSWLAPSKLRRTAIVGSEKMVVYDDTSNEPVRIFDSGVVLRDPQTFGEYRLTYRTGDIVSPRVDTTEPLALELQNFCEAVRGHVEPRSTVALGTDVVRIIEAVERSLDEQGAPVAVERARASTPESAD